MTNFEKWLESIKSNTVSSRGMSSKYYDANVGTITPMFIREMLEYQHNGMIPPGNCPAHEFGQIFEGHFGQCAAYSNSCVRCWYDWAEGSAEDFEKRKHLLSSE